MAGRGETLRPAPGRIMLVPPTATFEDFGLGVDLALGRWDVTHRRSFRAGWHGRHERRGAGSGELPPDRTVHGQVSKGMQFEYLFDDDEKWIHECVVEEFVARREVEGRAPIPVPVLGWGPVPDQFGRTVPEEVGLPDSADRAEPVEPTPTPTPPARSTKSRRRHRGTATPLDLTAVRAASRRSDVGALLEGIEGRDLGPALQQVGDALLRTYRSAEPADQERLVTSLREIESLLGHRGWEGDEVLAEEIDVVLSGPERRGRTLSVDIEELSEVMANGGDDPGGYLHLDTGEVVYAFIHHGMDDLDTPEPEEEVDNLWIYVDHDTEAAYADMAAFAEAASDRFAGILSVAIRGKGAFARFRRTVDELDLWGEWQVFSDDRAFGRARALLRSQGIRPV
ncbi:hypothetical protein IDVR_17220 [Intrasporangium sp. DVR]